MKNKKILFLILLSTCVSSFVSCSQTSTTSSYSPIANVSNLIEVESSTTSTPLNNTLKRDPSPQLLLPSAPGTVTLGNEVASIDASNTSEGYIMVKYTGSCAKVKLQLAGPDGYVCTYDLTSSDFQSFPLTSGNGTYTIGVFENIKDTSYSTAFKSSVEVTLSNQFRPYLYPNQYVPFNADTYAVKLGSELCTNASSDLDCVTLIYNYIISHITYDHEKADKVIKGELVGYISQIDTSLNSKKGICLDYAAIMTCMLRTQGIPTRLEVGYASEAYHAWISVYLDEIGWVNGIIEFDGKNWKLMDPTFAASSSEKTLKRFIGDGNNYTLKYTY